MLWRKENKLLFVISPPLPFFSFCRFDDFGAVVWFGFGFGFGLVWFGWSGLVWFGLTWFGFALPAFSPRSRRHIECSTMSAVLGPRIDIHTGGLVFHKTIIKPTCFTFLEQSLCKLMFPPRFDLLFPHHENEIAQCGQFFSSSSTSPDFFFSFVNCVCFSYETFLIESYHKCNQWVNYFLHTGHVMFGKEKMSKSIGNVVTIQNFLKEYTANQLRLFCLLYRYRSQ